MKWEKSEAEATVKQGGGDTSVTGWCYPVPSPQPCQVQLKLCYTMGKPCSPQPFRHR